MGADSDRPPRKDDPQPFGPPVGSGDWLSAPPPPQYRSRESRPADTPPRIVRRAPERPEWAIDPSAVQLTTTSRRPRRSGARRWIIGCVVAVVVVAAGIVATLVVTTRPEPGTPAAAAPATTASVAPTTAASGPQIPPCPAGTRDGTTVGNGEGGTADGPAAILGFEYGYYTARSGSRAQEFVAPDTVNVADAAGLQEAIDTQIPIGTVYCVHIVARESSLFDVDVDEYRPDGARTVYRQSVRTVVRDGRTLLYEIRDR
ncbi:hypothetical protein NONO_c13910 [Nocardia nova SH22a]|uniref:DUF8176 domain-containing protein n=2 Tax=Nocardia nova TaxID=37330 RepID=W5TAL5_9NOCA|nr:hypothetical protein NONO_c13910 [Nocardia nova SH22a]